jgi:hypothetical protein
MLVVYNIAVLTLYFYDAWVLNSDFDNFASRIRAASAALKEAANAAAKLHRPEINFSRAIRLLDSIALYADRQLIWMAYIKHNALTEAPAHPRNAARLRAGRMTSSLKQVAARRNGRAGGKSTSWLKQEAARENGKRGGRPRKVLISEKSIVSSAGERAG